MSRKSAREDVGVYSAPSVRSFPRVAPGLWTKLWEWFTKQSYRASEWAINFGVLAKQKVLLPSVLYLFALLDVSARCAHRLWFELVCFAHTVRVSAGRLKANRITAASIMASVTAAAISVTFFGLGFSLRVNGQEVGYLMHSDDLSRAIESVESQVSAALGRPYGLNPNVTLSFGVVEREKVLTSAEIEQVLVSAVSEISDLYVLTVDGKAVGASYNEETLRAALNEFSALKTNGTVLKTSYNRDVKIEKTVAETSLICSADELKTTLSGEIQTEQYYTIVRGDSWEKIAHEHGLSVEQLKEMNPETPMRRGKQLLVSEAIPFLSVETIVQTSDIQSVDYKTVEEKNASMYVGTQKVTQNGARGNARVTVNTTYRDGQAVASEQVSYEMLKAPVDRVVQVGTKPLPKASRMSPSGDGVATGSFIRPVSGAIVYSDYGYRKSGFHSGVDLAVSAGTPIYAADGGTVTFSGYKGAYGKLIIINHGNGLTTYYAHNAANNVRVGQKVSRGQKIGAVGSTGNSTGPHCHFEVRKNGKSVNPWRYIS